MMEPTPLGSIGAFHIYPYSLTLVLGIALGLLLFLFCASRRGLSAKTLLSFCLWALPCGLVGARLFYCLVRIGPLWVDFGPSFLWRLNLGGYGVMGALFGVLLAGWIAGKRNGVAPAELLDSAAPGAAVALGMARLGEAFTLEGLGSFVEHPGFQRFPFAVRHAYYEEWYIPVFLLEALAAFAIAVFLLLRMRRAGEKAGSVTLWFLLLFSASQIFLESLRQDAYLRWGFVRVNQIFCAGLMLAVAGIWARAAILRGAERRRVVLLGLPLPLGVGLLIAIEFALDKSTIPNGWLHLGMAVVLILMVMCTVGLWRAGKDAHHAKEDL